MSMADLLKVIRGPITLSVAVTSQDQASHKFFISTVFPNFCGVGSVAFKKRVVFILICNVSYFSENVEDRVVKF